MLAVRFYHTASGTGPHGIAPCTVQYGDAFDVKAATSRTGCNAVWCLHYTAPDPT